NAICPGSFRTAMSERLFGDALDTSMVATTPMGRLGGLDEIAAAVLFLLSDAASFVTGAALPVEGGKRAR
ncbi:short chain dehydrogenase, partial [Prosthecomicrobium hirschii]|uniref:SDR family oxidoreductase n=1 Tax=Prosthecodimorpha hirschii TaxID=665126 RepID=UPI00112ACA6E